MAQNARTDVVQLGEEVTFILQETHKRFANLTPTECLYVSSFLIHQLPEQTDLLNQCRLAFATPPSSTRRDSQVRPTQPQPLQPLSCGTTQSTERAAPEAPMNGKRDLGNTRASTATASTLETPASDALDPCDEFCEDDVDGGIPWTDTSHYHDTQQTAASVKTEGEDSFGNGTGSGWRGAAQPSTPHTATNSLRLNLSSVLNRRGSRDADVLDGYRQDPLSVWQQSAVLILQNAARAFRRYEEDENREDEATVRAAAGRGVRVSLQRALEEAANQWANGSGSQWQTPRAGVSTVAANLVANTPRVGPGAGTGLTSSAASPAREGQPRRTSHKTDNAVESADSGEVDDVLNRTLLMLRSAEEQARMACRAAYEELYVRTVTDTRRTPEPDAPVPLGHSTPSSGAAPSMPAAPLCSLVIECDAPDNGASSAVSSPRSPAPSASSHERSEPEAALLTFVIGCDFAQLEYLQQTVFACACDPYPGSELPDSELTAMDVDSREALAAQQYAWRQRHCLVRILEPSSLSSANNSETTSVTDGVDTLTAAGALTYTLGDGFFALRSLLGLALEVCNEMDPHLVALVEDPELSQRTLHVIPGAIFWSAWPNSVPLRPHRGEQRASLRGGPHLPLPLLPGTVLTVDEGGARCNDSEDQFEEETEDLS